MSHKEYLLELASMPWFQAFKKDVLLKGIPQPRSFNPRDAEDSVEQWKADCMRRDGYILCLHKLGINPEENDRE